MNSNKSNLMIVDLLDLVQNYGEKGKYCFRKEELKFVYELVKANRHILIVGKEGSGKKYLIDSLARKLMLEKSRSTKMHKIEMLSLMQGTEERGSLEKRLIEIANIPPKISRLILVFPNIHLFIKAGATHENPQSGVINMMIELLSDERRIVIGETTLNGLQLLNHFTPWIQHKFEILILKPMSDGDTINSIKTYTEEHPELPQLNDNAFLTYLIQTAKRILTNLDSPGNALTLFQKIAPYLKDKKDQIETASNISTEIVDKVVSRSTGLLPQLFNKEPINRLQIVNELKKHYKGYTDLLEQMVDLFLRFKAHLSPPNRPAASVLIMGPTGVGKTELVRVVTKFMYRGDLGKLHIYDMTEFPDETALRSLIGDATDPFSTGRLIRDINQDPFSVFLFDEIEKAHPSVRNLFLQILGDGRITDPFGNTYSFVNSFIFMSSNVGFQKDSIFYKNGTFSNEEIFESLKKEFPRELINRIEKIFIFDFLDKETLKEIAEKELLMTFGISHDHPLARSFFLETAADIKWDKDVVEYISKKGFSKEFGAREILRVIEDEIILPLSNKICENPEISKIQVSILKNQVELKVS